MASVHIYCYVHCFSSSTTSQVTHSCPNHTNSPSTSGCEQGGRGCHHNRMPSCSHHHLGLLNNFTMMYHCSLGCPTSAVTKTSTGHQSWAMWTNHSNSYCGRLIHPQNMHFQFGVIKASCQMFWSTCIRSFLMCNEALYIVPMGAHCRPNGCPWAQNVGL